MAGFADFNKRWASGGSVSEPTDSQKSQGFSFLGQTPPSVELFNSMFQSRDDQINWLYGQVASLLQAGGITPAASPNTQMLQAGRNLFGGGSTNARQWTRLPDGLVVQWGTYSGTPAYTTNPQFDVSWIAEYGVAVTFPVAFPNECLTMQLTANDQSSPGVGNCVQEIAFVVSTTRTGFVGALSSRAAGLVMTANYLAIGR